MKLLLVLFFLSAVLVVIGCSKDNSLLQPQAVSQQTGIEVLWNPDPAIFSVTANSGNAVILDENPGEIGSGDDSQQNAWYPISVNGKLNLVWWSVWETTPEEVDHQVKVGWSDENQVMHEAWVTPVYWDGVEPAICQKDPYNDIPNNDIPRVFAFRSMAEYLAAQASASPIGKIVLRKNFGGNVQNWTEVWQKAAEELAVYLPAAVKWTNHATDRATFERLWGEDFWAPDGDWDGWYPYLVSENFGLD